MISHNRIYALHANIHNAHRHRNVGHLNQPRGHGTRYTSWLGPLSSLTYIYFSLLQYTYSLVTLIIIKPIPAPKGTPPTE